MTAENTKQCRADCRPVVKTAEELSQKTKSKHESSLKHRSLTIRDREDCADEQCDMRLEAEIRGRGVDTGESDEPLADRRP